MNRIRPKQPRVRLDPELVRTTPATGATAVTAGGANGAGARSNLEVHHKEFRSQGGDDSEANLITLCVACHSLVHRGAKLLMA